MTDQVGKLVIKRMKKTLTEEHFQRIVFLPPLTDQDYTIMYGAVDVVLDSFPFGGHTSTMDALSIGRPVVTLPTEFMSGRCTQVRRGAGSAAVVRTAGRSDPSDGRRGGRARGDSGRPRGGRAFSR